MSKKSEKQKKNKSKNQSTNAKSTLESVFGKARKTAEREEGESGFTFNPKNKSSAPKKPRSKMNYNAEDYPENVGTSEEEDVNIDSPRARSPRRSAPSEADLREGRKGVNGFDANGDPLPVGSGMFGAIRKVAQQAQYDKEASASTGKANPSSSARPPKKGMVRNEEGDWEDPNEGIRVNPKGSRERNKYSRSLPENIDVTGTVNPLYYGGKNIAGKAIKNLYRKFQPYTGDRVAPLTGIQKDVMKRVGEEVKNPLYKQRTNQAYENVGAAGNKQFAGNLLNQIQPRILNNPTENAELYMNPYQNQVIENIGKYASRNLHENILPGINDRFVSAGQYGSSGHQNLTNRAVRDTQEGVSRAQSEALQSGYNKALDTSVGQQQTGLQYGDLASNAQERELNRRAGAGIEQAKLAGNIQNQTFAGLGQLGAQGNLEQQQNQNAATQAFQNFTEKQEYPWNKLERAQGILGRQPYNRTPFYTGAPPREAAGISAATRLGGLFGGLYGASQMGGANPGFAHGGHVGEGNENENAGHVRPHLRHIRHMAEGGQPISPIQNGVNDALDTSELRMMREHAMKLQQPQVDPFWAAIARAGFAMAGSNAKDSLGAAAEGGQAGLNEYQAQQAAQGARMSESTKIFDLISNTKEARYKHESDLQQRNLEHQEMARHHLAAEGLESGRFGLEKEKFAHEKKYMKGEHGRIYQTIEDEEGNERLVPSEPMEATSVNPEYQKAMGKNQAKVDADIEAEVKQVGSKAYEQLHGIDDLLNTVDEAKTGTGFTARRWGSNFLNSIGIDSDVLGNPDSMGRLQKGLTRIALDEAKTLQTRPTNFDLEVIIEGLPKGSDNPDTVKSLLKIMRVQRLYQIERKKAMEDVLKHYGTIRMSYPEGDDWESRFNKYADEKIWSQLKNIKGHKKTSAPMESNSSKPD